MPRRLPYLRPIVPPLERILPRLRAVWRRRYFSNYGVEERLFTRRLSQRFDGRQVVVVANGTQACEIALEAVGVRGRPVYLPSFTFMATVTAVLRTGGIPRFVDIDPATWTMNPNALPDRLAADAILFPVHVFGVPAAHRALAARNRPLIYDACEAIGSRYGQKDVAACGDIACFSTHTTKLLPAGEGGFLVTADRRLAERLRRLRNFGQLGDQNPTVAGTNAKLSELHAALANASLSAFDRVLRHRRRQAAAYRRALQSVPGLTLQHYPDETTPNGQIMGVKLEDEFGMNRDAALAALARRGIECRAYFNPPGHLYPLCAGLTRRGALPVTEDLARRVLCLPFTPEMNNDDFDYVAESLRRLARARASRARRRP